MSNFRTAAIYLSLVLVATPSFANIVITEIDLANNRVELVNQGDAATDVGAWQWCNRVNGSPAYRSVSSVSTIDAALSTRDSLNMQPGDVLVLTVNDNFLPDTNGELGLYTSGPFSSPDTIVDYVVWGGNGVRDSVADIKMIWTDNESIDISGLTPGQTIQLGNNLPGNAAGDYSFGDANFGSFGPGGLVGDYNNNNELDADDLDLHARFIAEMDLTGDVNQDGVTNASDRSAWVETLQGSWLGDSNFDGEFNSDDLIAVFSAGKYTTEEFATYAEGDWDGNMVFDADDLIAAFSEGGYAVGPRPEAAVPEPSTLLLALLGLILWRVARR